MAHDVACVAHLHSTHSDGTATVPELVAAARAGGARVLLLTDHDTLGARRAGEDGWQDGVLVVAGHEVSPRGGHLLVFGVEEEIPHAGRSETEILDAVQAAGGFGIAAHPFSEGSRMSRRIGRPHPWSTFGHPALAGVELWSLTTDAAEAWRSPAEALRFLRAPEAFLDGPPRRHLRRWDALLQRRRLAAIGGLDAHAPGVRVRGRVLSPMPHARYLRMLHTHLHLDAPLTGEAAADTRRVLEALREGRAHLGLSALAPAAGFDLWAEGDGRRVAMGGTAPSGRWTVHVRCGRPGRIAILRDGRPFHCCTGDRASATVEGRGVVRVEVALTSGGRPRTWIVSNAITFR